MAPSFAAAQPKHSSFERKEAEQRFERGKKFHAQGKFAEAIEEFEAAYKLAPLPSLLFNLGESYRAKGDKAHALDMYRRYLEERPNGKMSDVAKDQIVSLSRAIADEQAAAVVPPPHSTGSPSPDPQAPSRERSTSPPEPQHEDALVERDQSGPPGRMKKTVGLVSGGVGVALVGVGIYYGVHARHREDDVKAQCVAMPCPQATFDRLNSDGESASTKAAVLLTVGGAAAVAGTVLYILGTREQRTAHVAVAPLPEGGAMISVAGLL